MTLKAVFFDMGGTIETFGFTNDLRLRATVDLNRILLRAGIDLGLFDEELLRVVLGGIKAYHDLCLETLVEYSPEKVWQQFVFKDFKIDPEKLNKIADELQVFYENHYYERAMRPEIPEVLDSILEMGLKLGVISNVNSRKQVPESLEKYGIAQYFNPVVLSSEYGIRKPDPSIFHYAARLMNVPTSSCVYVGDRITRDIIGSKKAGFALSIQIQHDFEHGEIDDGAVPDAIIENMTELIDILKQELDKPQRTPLAPIRAFLFDAGDILYFRPRRKNEFSLFLKEMGIDESKNRSAEKAALTRQAFKGQIDQEEFFTAYLNLLGIDDPALVKRGRSILEGENSDVKFFDGVRDTLLILKQKGYLLGIITDTANSVQAKLKWFEQGGFGHVWDSIISSKEIGLEKPDPGIYQAALNQLGITALQAVFVGHRKSELDGAKALGIKTIAFNQDPDATADLYVKDFNELIDATKRLNFDRSY